MAIRPAIPPRNCGRAPAPAGQLDFLPDLSDNALDEQVAHVALVRPVVRVAQNGLNGVPTVTTLKASQTRIPPDTFNRVAYQGERVRIERRGAKPVFLVSEEDLALLEQLEDRYWVQEGRKALEEFEKSGQKPVPWERIKDRLGL